MKVFLFKLRTCARLAWWGFGWRWGDIGHDEWCEYYDDFCGDSYEAAMEGWCRE